MKTSDPTGDPAAEQRVEKADAGKAEPGRVSGTLRAVYQFNVGARIELRSAEEHLPSFQPSRGKLQTSRRIPADFGYGDDPPVRIMFGEEADTAGQVDVDTVATIGENPFRLTEVTFYEFGVVEVILETRFENLPLEKLLQLRARIADENSSEPIFRLAERLMLKLVEIVDSAIVERFIEPTSEDYAIVVITGNGDKQFNPARFVRQHRQQISQLIAGETKPHSADQADYLAGRKTQLSIYQDSVFFVDYYSTVIIGVEDPDISDVVLIVCAQGLELQYLTDLAEKYIDETRRLVSQQEVTQEDYSRIQAFILDLSARLAVVKNAVNLIGDPDLKRLFVRAIERLDIRDPLRDLRKSVDSMSGMLNTETNIGLSREVAKYDRWILIGVVISCLLSLLYMLR